MTPTPTPPSPPTLRFTEWILTGALLVLVASIFFISKVQSRRFSVDTAAALPPVEVNVQGQVAKPGLYPVAIGTPLSEVILKARPGRFADLSGIDPEARVRGPLRLELKVLEKLTIAVEGEIEAPGPLTVPVGTRVCDLKKYVTVKAGADLAFFKKRRLLNNGEKITIPQGKQEY
jgi:hypothetical protein